VLDDIFDGFPNESSASSDKHHGWRCCSRFGRIHSCDGVEETNWRGDPKKRSPIIQPEMFGASHVCNQCFRLGASKQHKHRYFSSATNDISIGCPWQSICRRHKEITHTRYRAQGRFGAAKLLKPREMVSSIVQPVSRPWALSGNSRDKPDFGARVAAQNRDSPMIGVTEHEVICSMYVIC
jgi:hypothetical protein